MKKPILIALLLNLTALAMPETFTINGSLQEAQIQAGLQSIPFKVIVENTTEDKYIVDLKQGNYMDECENGTFTLLEDATMGKEGYQTFTVIQSDCISK